MVAPQYKAFRGEWEASRVAFSRGASARRITEISTGHWLAINRVPRRAAVSWAIPVVGTLLSSF
jgi:hypothetical protein